MCVCVCVSGRGRVCVWGGGVEGRGRLGPLLSVHSCTYSSTFIHLSLSRSIAPFFCPLCLTLLQSVDMVRTADVQALVMMIQPPSLAQLRTTRHGVLCVRSQSCGEKLCGEGRREERKC